MSDLSNHEPYDDKNPTGDGVGSDRVSDRTRLLRAAANGELSAEQQVELQRHLALHPQDQAVIDFEERLRETIEMAACEPVPESLRERIRAMGQEASPGAAPVVGNTPTEYHPSIRFPRPARWLAVAASLAIVTGGAYMVIRPALTPHAEQLRLTPQYRASLVSFIHAQHEECELYTDLIGERFQTSDLGSVPSEFSRVLGGTPDIGDVQQYGFKLLGAGPCAVPGRGKSVRMVLESNAESRPGDDAGSLVSIHIQQDTGELTLESGRTYRLVEQSAPSAEADTEIYVWRRNGFIYFLTSGSESTMQTALTAFGVQEPSEAL